MITNHTHAQAVQKRRVKAGKFGYAKAVRRCFKRLDTSATKLRLPANWRVAPT